MSNVWKALNAWADIKYLGIKCLVGHQIPGRQMSCGRQRSWRSKCHISRHYFTAATVVMCMVYLPKKERQTFLQWAAANLKGHVQFQNAYARKPEFNHVRGTMSERPCQRDHVRQTMSERPCQSHSCQRGCSLVSGWVYGLRVCFDPRGKTRPQLFTGKKPEGVFYPSGKTRPHLYLWR